MSDDAALAHAGYNDAAIAFAATHNQIDSPPKVRSHWAFEPRGQRFQRSSLCSNEPRRGKVPLFFLRIHRFLIVQATPTTKTGPRHCATVSAVPIAGDGNTSLRNRTIRIEVEAP